METLSLNLGKSSSLLDMEDKPPSSWDPIHHGKGLLLFLYLLQSSQSLQAAYCTHSLPVFSTPPYLALHEGPEQLSPYNGRGLEGPMPRRNRFALRFGDPDARHARDEDGDDMIG